MKAKRSENFILQFNIATWHEQGTTAAMEIHTYGTGGGEGTLATRLFAALLEILRERKSWTRLMSVQRAKHATEKRHFKQLFLSFC
jgi:hypothetical protein